MSYTVIWKHGVVRQLSAAYLSARKRADQGAEAITEAVAEIDRLLAQNPARVGESRADYERVLILLPLVVTYEVYEEEHVVYLLRFRYLPRQQPDS